MNTRPNVVLMIELSTIYGRRVLSGVGRYQRAHSSWSVLLDEMLIRSARPDDFDSRNCSGILCRATSPDSVGALKNLGIPVVDMNDKFGYLGLPRVSSNMKAIGKMALDHLIERGFHNIAYYGYHGVFWSERRRQGVQESIGGRAKLCGVYEIPFGETDRRGWLSEKEALCAWLESMPRPLGVIATNDEMAYSILDACKTLDIAVPEEIALVGCDNAEIFCELCDPPLSSVVPDAERVGYEAAKLLDMMMAGEQPPQENLLILPREVKTRSSSEVLAISDPVVAGALRFIRENACRGIGVENVQSHVSASRSVLERGFRRFLGHSPQEEIRRIRLARVKQLLVETDWSLTRIAEETGFEYPNYMMVQFKRTFGQTPSQWRKCNQGNFT